MAGWQIGSFGKKEVDEMQKGLHNLVSLLRTNTTLCRDAEKGRQMGL